MKYCKVKFVNNKCYWYSGEFEKGDLVYCEGSQQGVLGKVIDTSDNQFGFAGVTKVGHIDLENEDDLRALWASLDKGKKTNILKSLGATEPYNLSKFMNFASNTWTVKGYEGMSWTEYLDYVNQLADHEPLSPEPDNRKRYCFDGYEWVDYSESDSERIDPIEYHDLIAPIIYGPKNLITEVYQEYDLEEMVECRYGIWRALVPKGKETKIMAKYPAVKMIAFDLWGNVDVLYSESGYGFMTHLIKRDMYFGESESPWLMKAIPDMIFRDSAPNIHTGDRFEVIYNAPGDSYLKALNYVIEHEGKKYQMIGIDPTDPPEQADPDWIYKKQGETISIVRYTGHDKHVVFPSMVNGIKVKRIENRIGDADECYSNIESVTIPMGYEYIGSNAFSGCKNLTKIDIAASVNRIGDCAFYKCVRLKEVHLPAMLKSLYHDYENTEGGMYAFFGCRSLENVYYHSSSFEYKEAHAFPKGVHVRHADSATPDKITNVQNIIDKQPVLHVYDFKKMTVIVHPGEIMHMESVPMGVTVITEDNQVAGVLMRDQEEQLGRRKIQTIVEDQLFRDYTDMIEGVVVSEIHPFMGDDGFEIEIRLRSEYASKATVNRIQNRYVNTDIKEHSNIFEGNTKPEVSLKDRKSFEIGDKISFGRYFQGKDDKKRPLYWYIIDLNNNQMTLLSKYAIHSLPYHSEKKNITWETCSLREYLNDQFYNAAFNEKEQTAILNMPLEPALGEGKSLIQSRRTRDKVFLLDADMVGNLPDEIRICYPTKKAVAENSLFRGRGLSTEDYTYWWLRNPGKTNKTVLVCGGYGITKKSVDSDTVGVRPVIVVNLNNNIFGGKYKEIELPEFFTDQEIKTKEENDKGREIEELQRVHQAELDFLTKTIKNAYSNKMAASVGEIEAAYPDFIETIKKIGTNYFHTSAKTAEEYFIDEGILFDISKANLAEHTAFVIEKLDKKEKQKSLRILKNRYPELTGLLNSLETKYEGEYEKGFEDYLRYTGILLSFADGELIEQQKKIVADQLKTEKTAKKKTEREEYLQRSVDRIPILDPKIQKKIERLFTNLEKYYPEHAVFSLDAMNKAARENASSLAKEIGYENYDDMFNAYGWRVITGDEVKEIRSEVVYTPGNEPEFLKIRLDNTVKSLNDYYPDHIIRKSLQTEHKSLSSTVMFLSQWLGYENTTAFLKAYGFTYLAAEKKGRPTTLDADMIISILKEKTQDKPYDSFDDLKNDNLELTGNLKTLANNAKSVFGTTMVKYFRSIGIISSGRAVSVQAEKKNDSEEGNKEGTYSMPEAAKRYAQEKGLMADVPDNIIDASRPAIRDLLKAFKNNHQGLDTYDASKTPKSNHESALKETGKKKMNKLNGAKKSDEAEVKRRAEEERIAKDKAEVEARKKAEEEQRAEQERIRKAEEERIAKEKEEAERLERLRKEEEARLAKEKAEAEAKRKAEEERLRKEEAKRQAEEKARKEREEAEAERKRIEEIKKKEALELQEKLRKYKEAHDKWLSDCEEAKSKRSNRVDELIEEEKVKLLMEATKRRDESLNVINERIANETKRQSLAESTLTSLGLFKFGEKKKQKAIIEEASSNIAEAKKELENVNHVYNSEISVIDETVKKKTINLRNIAAKEYPMPEEPVRPIEG